MLKDVKCSPLFEVLEVRFKKVGLLPSIHARLTENSNLEETKGVPRVRYYK